MKIVAVCISKNPVEWKVPEIPFVNYTGGYRDYPHFPRLKTRFRIEYLAERRNAANRLAIDQYPDVTHFFSIDSYYLDDVEEIRNLVKEYIEQLHARQGQDNVILGASTWYLDPSKIRLKRWYWDTWTNPEFLGWEPDGRSGWVKTKGAGGFTIYPKWVWEAQGYGIPEPFPESGCESNYLSRCPDTKTFISFNVKAWRDPPEELKNKPYINRIRTTVGLRTRLHIPDIWWIVENKILWPRNRSEWIKGKIWADGFQWNVRGVNDSFLSWRGHEKWLRNEILQKGEEFVDVGTHVGTWSIRASRYYSHVDSFEPSNPTRKLLLKNIATNHVSNITVHAQALGSQWSEGVMHTFGPNGGNSLEDRHPILARRQPRTVNTVEVRTLDSFNLSPTTLKIDTEGHELPILAGAKETLKRTQKVIVESHRDEDTLVIRDLLKDYGFNARLIVDPSEVHIIGER